MPRKKLFAIIGAVILLAIGILIACIIFQNNSNTSSDDVSEISIEYLSDTLDLSNATYITSENGEISINGSGAVAKNGAVTIGNKGVYVLKGDFTELITINAEKSDVYLVLDGANISNDNGAAIYATKVATLYLAATENTTNAISDGADYSENYGTEDVDAAVYSKGNIALIGNGEITINGNHYHGIHSKDYLQVLGGTFNITASRNGLMGKDYVAIKDGTLNITCDNDGIKSNNDSDTKLGYIAIDGGTITINSVGDAIQAETRVSITGGNFNITTGGGAKNTSTNYSQWGNWRGTNVNSESNTSAKGVKAEKYVLISGGTFNLSTSDDALHSNTNIVISGGTFGIKSGDDGIHADTSLTINGGTIDITQSHEGIESAEITINEGTINIIASDDGFNAAGGNDSSSTNGRQGQGFFSSSTGTLTINGGTIYVNAGGDGLDSNGAMYITGGYIAVDGPTNNGNGALDHDGTFEISGGTLIAAGSSGMLELPSTTSTQNSICIVFSSTPSAGTEFALKDTSGNTILTYTPSKQYASIVISSPNIKTGESYTAYTDGTEVATITINSTVTSYGTNGGMNRGGNGGMRR